MKDRIIRFIEAEKLTAAEFADKIGVQRSNVSHVLNGRNNPGFSFIQKILESFPLINSRWLITGEGDIYINKKSVIDTIPQTLFSTEKKAEIPSGIIQPEVSKEAEKPLRNNDIKEIPEVIMKTSVSKNISKVLIFYSDHTFEDFRPAE